MNDARNDVYRRSSVVPVHYTHSVIYSVDQSQEPTAEEPYRLLAYMFVEPRLTGVATRSASM